jgi:ribose transport system permease protein
LREAAAPIVLSLLLLVVLAVFVRIAISQADRRSIAPAVIFVVAALVLLGAYLISHDGAPADTPAVEEGQ